MFKYFSFVRLKFKKKDKDKLKILKFLRLRAFKVTLLKWFQGDKVKFENFLTTFKSPKRYRFFNYEQVLW